MIDKRLHRSGEAVRVINEKGSSPYVLVCEHASNFVPEQFAGLGLDDAALNAHIAWDPGAIEVSRYMSEALDATLVEACISRLVIDCNRPLDASDLVPPLSETTSIPGNQDLSAAERQERIDISHVPFHGRLEEVIAAREKRGQPSFVISIHSFTPVYRGVSRPWPIGIIHDADERLAGPLIAALKADPQLHVGVNEPYSPDDRVYYTLERHARARGALCAMVEIRNDEIAHDDAHRAWAGRLSTILRTLEVEMNNEGIG